MNEIINATFKVSYRTSDNKHYHSIDNVEFLETAEIDGLYSLLVWFHDGTGEAIPLVDARNIYITVDKHFDFIEEGDR